MAFDSKDTAAFKGVWVFCEQCEGVIMPTGYQLLSEGRKLANDLGVELADVLGGLVGSSRAVADAGWISAEHQVGQTGKTVHPRIYVALGISGAIQRLAGMQDTECIIAVNKNESAPIFDVASYGIVGDLYKVIPMLIEAIRAAKAAM